MSIVNNLITSSAVDFLTVPALTSYAVVGIIFCNYGAADEVITVYAIPSGESADDSNTIMKNFTIPAGNSYYHDFKLLLGAADKITIDGTTGGLCNATVVYLAI